MHTFTHFTRFFYDWHQIHCIFLWKKNEHESQRRREKGGLKWTTRGFFPFLFCLVCFFVQYNVPAPRASECCIELGLCRWDVIEVPAVVYQEAEFSKKLDGVVLIFCGCRLCGLDGPCVSQTAGDCGELHAMGSLELGLCSGRCSPFFMSFFILDLLFWNQILT